LKIVNIQNLCRIDRQIEAWKLWKFYQHRQ
jgi:hypothetical protein